MTETPETPDGWTRGTFPETVIDGPDGPMTAPALPDGVTTWQTIAHEPGGDFTLDYLPANPPPGDEAA